MKKVTTRDLFVREIKAVAAEGKLANCRRIRENNNRIEEDM